jgi:hypothetical protein
MFINERAFQIGLAQKGLTAIAVACKLNTHHTTLSRWVRNWYPIPEKYQCRLVEILEVPHSKLFYNKDKMELANV